MSYNIMAGVRGRAPTFIHRGGLGVISCIFMVLGGPGGAFDVILSYFHGFGRSGKWIWGYTLVFSCFREVREVDLALYSRIFMVSGGPGGG